MGSPFTADEERTIVDQMRAGDLRARDRFIAANRPLVFVIAKSLGAGGSVSFEDLAAEGMVGLIEAADRFDPTLARFSTHATYWIRMHMLRAIVEQAGPFRISSVKMRRAWWKVGRVLREMFAAGEAVSYDDVAERMGLSATDLRAVMLTRIKAHVSMDAPVPDPDVATRSTVGDGMTDDVDPERTSADASAKRSEARQLARAVRRLSPRDRQVIAALYSDEPETLSSIGARLGLSRERVRQIKERALAKLAYSLPRDADGQVRLIEARARLLEADKINFSDEE